VKTPALIGGIVLCGVVAALAVALVHRGGGGPAFPQAVPVPNRPGFPAPPTGAVVFARELGSDALALGIVPQPGKVLLQASALGPDGQGDSRLTVGFTVQGASMRASHCGAGCYRAALVVHGRPAAVEVDLLGRTAARWRVALPASWPPRDASSLIVRADRAWRSLQSLAYRERLASDSTHAITSTWRVGAPDRLAYQIQGGFAAVVIGGRRWDRPPGGRWAPSEQQPIPQPVPLWSALADAHVLGTATVRGRPAWRVSFFDPVVPAWFALTLDRHTLHTLELHMTTTAHFMDDVYGSFDTAAPIVPPLGR
jgi:hypothetical protein